MGEAVGVWAGNLLILKGGLSAFYGRNYPLFTEEPFA